VTGQLETQDRKLKDDIKTRHDVKYCSWSLSLKDNWRLFQLLQIQRHEIKNKLEMWVNAQRDGRPVEYKWRPLFNAAKFG